MCSIFVLPNVTFISCLLGLVVTWLTSAVSCHCVHLGFRVSDPRDSRSSLSIVSLSISVLYGAGDPEPTPPLTIEMKVPIDVLRTRSPLWTSVETNPSLSRKKVRADGAANCLWSLMLRTSWVGPEDRSRVQMNPTFPVCQLDPHGICSFVSFASNGLRTTEEKGTAHGQ